MNVNKNVRVIRSNRSVVEGSFFHLNEEFPLAGGCFSYWKDQYVAVRDR